MNGIALVEPFRRVVAGQPPQNNGDLTRSRRFALLSHVIEKMLISRYTFSARDCWSVNKIMAPSSTERDELFRGFARALFKGDMVALYSVLTPDFLWTFHDGLAVTKSLAGAAAIAEHLAEQKALFSAQRFHDVAYHHAGDMTFMTFRVSETVRATGEQREQRGVECYTFRDGRLATKDVYRKPTGP